MAGVLQRGDIIAALQHGFSDAEIAKVNGVTQSAVCQFIEAQQLEEYRAGKKQFEELDGLYNELELVAVKKLQSTLKLAVLDPLKLCAVIKTINTAKRRSLSEGVPTINVNNTRLVNINLPEHVRVKATLNANSEVVEIDGRTIATIEAGKIDAMAAAQKEKNRENLLQQLI